MTKKRSKLNQIGRVEFISGAKTREITNKHQFDRMVEFMVENPTFAAFDEKAKIVRNSDMYKKLLEKLSVQLNMRGPPMRTIANWKKVWVLYKCKIIKKCKLANTIKLKNQRIRDIGGCGSYKEVTFNANEMAIKELIFDKPIKPINIFSEVVQKQSKKYNLDSATSSSNKQEEAPPTIKTEPPDMFINVTDATNELQLVDVNLPSQSIDIDKSPTIHQTHNQDDFLLDANLEIEQQLSRIKRAKITNSRQTADIKQKQLKLKEELQELKEQKFELKRQQLKYKGQKVDLQKRELQMKEAAKLRNSINSKFKKIF